jgi:hypothetical protein
MNKEVSSENVIKNVIVISQKMMNAKHQLLRNKPRYHTYHSILKIYLLNKFVFPNKLLPVKVKWFLLRYQSCVRNYE